MTRLWNPLLLTALLLHCCAANCGQPRLGRLFFTAEQRVAFARAEQLPVAGEDADDTRHGEFVLDGEIRRSNGKVTRWANGQLLPETTRLPPGLRVGDRLHREDGRQESIIKNGMIELKQRKASP